MTTPIAPSAEMPVRSRKQQILIKPKTPSAQSIPTQPAQNASIKTLSEQAQQPAPHFGMFGPRCSDEEANDFNYVRMLLQRQSPGQLAIDLLPKTTNPDVVQLIAERFQKAYGNIDHPAFHGNKSTMLHCMVYRGKPDLIQVLINMGADPNAQDRFEETAYDRIEKISNATKKQKQQIRYILENPPPKPISKPLFQWPTNPLPSVATITGFVTNTATQLYGYLPALPRLRFWQAQPSPDSHQSDSARSQDNHVSLQASHSQQSEDEAQPISLQQISSPAEVQHSSIQQASLPLKPQTRDYGVQVSDSEKQQMEKEISVLRSKREKLQQRLTESQQQQQTQEVDFFKQKDLLTQENRKLRQKLKKINKDAEQSTRTLEAQIDAASHENQSLREELQQKSKTAATRIGNLEEEQRDLQRKLAEAREIAQRHQKESEGAQQRAEQSLQKLKAQQTESRRSQSQQKKQSEQTQHLEHENQQLRKTLEEAQASQTQTREQLTQQLEAIQQENHTLKTELAEVQRKHTESSEQAKTSQQAAQRLQADLERTRRNHQHSQRRLHQEKDELSQQLQALGDQHLQTQQWYDWQLGNTQMQLGSTQMENQALYHANASFAQSHAWLSSQLAGTQQEAQSWQEYSNTLQTELEEARQPQRHSAMTEHIGRLMSEVSELRVRNGHLQQEIRQQHEPEPDAQEAPELHRSQVDRIEQHERSQAKAKSIKRSQSFSL